MHTTNTSRQTRAIQRTLLATAAIFLLFSSSAARANTFSFGTPGSGLSASADFAVSGGFLTITLTNTGKPAFAPSDVLTGVFFNGSGALSNPTGSSATGNVVLLKGSGIATPETGNGSITWGTDVAGEWAFSDDLNSAPQKYGVSSTGLGWFGPPDLINQSPNISGPLSPDGVQLGILSKGNQADPTNGGIANCYFVQDTVTITLGYTGSLASITKVTFQYGTQADEGEYPGTPGTPSGGPTPTPLPASAAAGMVLLGLFGVVRGFRRRTHS